MYGLLLEINLDLCGECGGCVAVCAFDALLLDDGGVKEICDRCTACNLCVITCPPRAISIKNEVKV